MKKNPPTQLANTSGIIFYHCYSSINEWNIDQLTNILRSYSLKSRCVWRMWAGIPISPRSPTAASNASNMSILCTRKQDIRYNIKMTLRKNIKPTPINTSTSNTKQKKGDERSTNFIIYQWIQKVLWKNMWTTNSKKVRSEKYISSRNLEGKGMLNREKSSTKKLSPKPKGGAKDLKDFRPSLVVVVVLTQWIHLFGLTKFLSFWTWRTHTTMWISIFCVL